MKKLLLAAAVIFAAASVSAEKFNFNEDWKFVKDCFDAFTCIERPLKKNVETVVLPHTPQIEPVVVLDQWQGFCKYQKSFVVKPEWADKQIYLDVEAAMIVADVWVNGQKVLRHDGGYLPFRVDLTPFAKSGEEIRITMRLDNRDKTSIPPGKPIKTLDFNWFGGLYRNVYLTVQDKLHITDAVSSGLKASGGLYVTYPLVSKDKASVKVKAHLQNNYNIGKNFQLVAKLKDMSGKTVAEITGNDFFLKEKSNEDFELEMSVDNPQLWSPQEPNLYMLDVSVIENSQVVDVRTERIGIRKVEATAGNLRINGEKIYLRGTNRHQEYPYLGYALTDAMQYRDAVKIKEAGFDMVRLSHYPQSPAFLGACDELGLVVMNAIPGWQWNKAGKFQDIARQNARDMIRRDRNHPSVFFWEVSLNEAWMTEPLISSFHNIVKEELPGRDSISCGWIDKIYDMFIPARQHEAGPDYWTDWSDGERPLFTAEYGDWEYYARMDANFNQTGAKGLSKEEINSRQNRKDGEARLLQQARNFQEAHNMNHKNASMIGDANWVFADYNRGYSPDHCNSGIVDIFRYPKPVYYFYQSQRPSAVQGAGYVSGPMVNIASWWNEQSSLDVRIFSNCDEVELLLNGQSLGRQKPDNDIFSDSLISPPFTFKLDKFVPGVLTAMGFIDGKEVVRSSVGTPGQAQQLLLTVDYSGRKVQPDGADAVFVYVKIKDKSGNLCTDDYSEVTLKTSGVVKVCGPATVKAEAGVAAFLVQSTGEAGEAAVTAECNSFSGIVEILVEE
jgi:beta-galactosidase